MEIKEVHSQDEARQQAIDWQVWQAGQRMTYKDMSAWSQHFFTTALKYDLLDEFKENGII